MTTIDIDFKENYAVITCHEYWNIERLQDVLRNGFTARTIDEKPIDLIIDLREANDVKHSKSFFIPIFYMVDKAYGVNSLAVVVVNDDGGASRLNDIARRLNNVSTSDVEVRVTHSMDSAVDMVKG